jgi:hypothetical protein
VETNGTSKRAIEGGISNSPERGGDDDLRNRAPREGIISNFHEAFSQLHLGQLRPSFKCVSRDRRNGGINPNADNILRDIVSDRPHVDEDLGIIGGIARHHHVQSVAQAWTVARTFSTRLDCGQELRITLRSSLIHQSASAVPRHHQRHHHHRCDIIVIFALPFLPQMRRCLVPYCCRCSS